MSAAQEAQSPVATGTVAKEKAAEVLRAPEAAIQKQSQQSVRPRMVTVNKSSGVSILEAMRASGLAPASRLDVVADGKLRRYCVQGDKPDSLNGWCVLFGAALRAGVFGSWRTDQGFTWCEPRLERASLAQRAKVAAQIKAQHAALEAARAERKRANGKRGAHAV